MGSFYVENENENFYIQQIMQEKIALKRENAEESEDSSDYTFCHAFHAIEPVESRGLVEAHVASDRDEES